jgi:hypothetical protein
MAQAAAEAGQAVARGEAVGPVRAQQRPEQPGHGAVAAVGALEAAQGDGVQPALAAAAAAAFDPPHGAPFCGPQAPIGEPALAPGGARNGTARGFAVGHVRRVPILRSDYSATFMLEA